MDEIRDRLNQALEAEAAVAPLAALARIGEIQRDLESREQEAVRAAIQGHSWSEIGAALGVSKQAAHQRLAKRWAAQLKDEIRAANRAHKLALREGRPDEAGTAIARRKTLIAEFKNATGRGKTA
jgi:DNA-binding NarL/FixJ family response regulator